MIDMTAAAKRYFEREYEIDAARGESVETALGEDDVLHVHAVKVAEAYAPEFTLAIVLDRVE